MTGGAHWLQLLLVYISLAGGFMQIFLPCKLVCKSRGFEIFQILSQSEGFVKEKVTNVASRQYFKFVKIAFQN